MELEKGIREKLAMFCHVNVKNILSVHDVSNIYHVPDMLQKQGLPNVICRWVFVLDLSLLSHPPLDLSLLSLSHCILLLHQLDYRTLLFCNFLVH